MGDVAAYDRLIADQEALLNVYRCRFGVDTHAVPGGCADGAPAQPAAPPGDFQSTPTAQDIEARDQLIAAQENLLNAYRCQHDIDTHIVPGGCADGASAQTGDTAGRYTAISAGQSHSCAIDTAGAIKCWGLNAAGQADAPEGGGYTAISAGWDHSCAIDTAGAIDCWGANGAGQADAPKGGGYTAISAGPGSFSCAIDTAGAIDCWGWNGAGQTDAPKGGGYTAISAGLNHSCAIATDQTIACWGVNAAGQTDAPKGGGYTAIAVGWDHSCAIAADQTIACWGASGLGLTDAPEGRYTAISAGSGWFSCAIDTAGAIDCWGDNAVLVTDAPEGRYTAISAGSGLFLCAIDTAGAIKCWGANEDGQTDGPQAPAAITPASGAVLIEVPADAPEGRCAEQASRGGYAWENCAWEPYRDNPEHNRALSDADADALIGVIWEEVEVEGKPADPPTSALVPTNAATACALGGVVLGCYDFEAHHITRSDAFTETLLHEVAHALMRDHPSVAECDQATFDSELQGCFHNDVFRCVADHLFTEYAGIPTAGVCGTSESSDDPACLPFLEFEGLVTSCLVEGTSWVRLESLNPGFLYVHSFLLSESNTFDHPYDDDTPTLNILCEDGSLSVFVDFDGQRISGQQALSGKIPVYYERDGSPPHPLENVLWEESENNEHALAPNPIEFADWLTATQELTFTAWNHDESLIGTIVFDTTGAAREINRVLSACGMSFYRPPNPTPAALAAPGR